MSAELWDLYDAGGARTGRTMRRGDAIPEGLYHLGVHIWPINSRGEFLVQRRAARVKWMPGMWSATGGCAVSGESALQAARRELFEELGYEAAEGELREIGLVRRTSAFCAVYALHVDLPASAFRLQAEEVERVAWRSRGQLGQMLLQNALYNYGDAYFRHLFDYQRTGAHFPRAEALGGS